MGRLSAFSDVLSKVPAFPPHSNDAAKVERQRNEVSANYRHGVQFAEGDGVTQDYTAAARFYRKAAEAGYAPAQYVLAELHEKSLGGERDLKQAAGWYRKAAGQGNAQAQNKLGVLYATGRGVVRNDAEAVRWYRLAAAQNDPEATARDLAAGKREELAQKSEESR